MFDAQRRRKRGLTTEKFNGILSTHAQIIDAPIIFVNSCPYAKLSHHRCMDTFGERVVELRTAAGIKNTTRLAKLVRLSQPTMWAIENGETSPSDLKAETLMRLVATLNTNAAYLWTGKGPIGPEIDPNSEEAEAASLYRQLSPIYKSAWLAAGYAMCQTQPPGKPSTDDPYPEAKKTPDRRSRK